MADFRTQASALGQDINAMLVFCSQNDCSDLFVKVGEPAQIYRYGVMYQTGRVTDQIAWNTFAKLAITSEENASYVREKMLDLSYQIGEYRYRVNCGFSTGQNIATFRMISARLPSFSSLKLDTNVVSLLSEAFSKRQGVTLLVGPTGSGKTSTLAACINSFSQGYGAKRDKPLSDGNLITLEDPIEYLYRTLPNFRVTQKELGRDFMSYELGIKSALREHPTHILVGETRDKETIRSLVEASRTGHACISTFHTSSVSDTISRLSSYLVAENRDILFDLIANLNFVLCQRLNRNRTGTSYILSYEYMFFDEVVKKTLAKAVYADHNVARTVDAIIMDESLVKRGRCHSWQANDVRKAVRDV